MATWINLNPCLGHHGMVIRINMDPCMGGLHHTANWITTGPSTHHHTTVWNKKAICRHTVSMDPSMGAYHMTTSVHTAILTRTIMEVHVVTLIRGLLT